MLEQIPDVRAVTADGDLIGPDWAVGGSAGGQSMLVIQATRDRAAAELTATRQRIDELSAALAGATAEAAGRAEAEASTLAALHHSDARMSAVAEELARFGSSARSAAAEADRLARQQQAAEVALEQHRTALSDLENRLYAAEAEEAPDEVDPEERDALAERTSFARQREVEARLVQRTAEERARATEGNAESLRRAGPPGAAAPAAGGRRRGQAHRQFGRRDQGRRGRPPGRRAAGAIVGRRGRRT